MRQLKRDRSPVEKARQKPGTEPGSDGRKTAAAALLISLSAAAITLAAIVVKRKIAKKNGSVELEMAPEPVRPPKRRIGTVIRILLIVVFSAGLIYSGQSLVRYYIASRGTESGIEALRSGLNSAPPAASTPAVVETHYNSAKPESPQAPEPSERAYELSERFSTLFDGNSDIVGWVTVEGTKIDYPVMQSKEDGQFYINHNFDGGSDDNGLPFLDERCVIAPKNQIQLVYGHNIKSGIMFHDLMRYESEEFWREHQYISYDTIYEEAVYHIVAAFVFDVAGADDGAFQFHRFTEFPTAEIFNAYMLQIKELALYDTGLDCGFEDEYLILATCEYSTSDSRFVLLAKQVT